MIFSAWRVHAAASAHAAAHAAARRLAQCHALGWRSEVVWPFEDDMVVLAFAANGRDFASLRDKYIPDQIPKCV